MNFPASQKVRLPDFIIGGAPKCGTTSLHFILARHPLVGIPDDEVHFFDADDPVGHPDFLFERRGGLEWYDPRPDHPEAMAWYASRFAELSDRPVIGEDSTIYLQSEVAPARIDALLPDVRLVFMLRDPVKRAYSQYWHLVTRGGPPVRSRRRCHAIPRSSWARPMHRISGAISTASAAIVCGSACSRISWPTARASSMA